MSKPWFWMLLIGTVWTLPMIKSLGASFPEPPPGFDRAPEAFELIDAEGRQVSSQDLAGFLLVVQSLDLGDPVQAEKDILAFRVIKRQLRSMAPILIHIVMTKGADQKQLIAFLDEWTARKPGNLFLLDHGGTEFARLVENGHLDGTRTLLLDRHGRLRGAFKESEEAAARLARLMTLLGNWEGCDPPLGEPAYH
ncbi:MAG: hypothetical protein ACI9F9_001790 [Candidatus Paceibacteria bacterium]|jgi:hypothetical protein